MIVFEDAAVLFGHFLGYVAKWTSDYLSDDASLRSFGFGANDYPSHIGIVSVHALM
jgi:hypothetical protein